MRLRLKHKRRDKLLRAASLCLIAILAWLGIAPVGGAAETPEAAPAAEAPASQSGPMNSGAAGWLGHVVMSLENEATSDVSMLPDTPSALEREWRSLDGNGSAIGALIGLGWVTLAACLALLAEKATTRGLSRRLRYSLRTRIAGPSVGDLLLLLVCDVVGLAVFAGVFVYSRHWLLNFGVSLNLILLAVNILIRWRILALIPRIVLRPTVQAARLIDVADGEARRLMWFLSTVLLAITALVGFGRLGLADEDSGAPHIIGLVVAAAVCGLDAWIVLRARGAIEALIRGYRTEGVIAAMRSALARAWVPIGLTVVGALFLFFVFGLSLGLLDYYHAFVSTLGVLLALLVLERLTERGWHDTDVPHGRAAGVHHLVALSFHRILRAIVLLIAALTLAWIWIDALDLPAGTATQATRSVTAAAVTLFVAYLAWELIRLAIDRNLQNMPGGPKMPGAGDDEEEATPASRLQTILPMMRAFFGVAIGLIAVLIVLSRLGVDTAPLIAGAGVFGLAVSFGSQSLVRDIISGLFYMWDDAFRVGEYIDTGRLKGTVESLGVRSVKLRHHNGPLHTIPYGQLGAVTNQSRDFATIKFNLRLEPGTDIELVRKTAKQIGLAMQEDSPEVASEVILPLKMQGIAEVADNAVVFRFKFTARPIKPSWIQREYLKRIYKVFAEKGINFASGALTLQTAPIRAGSPGSAAQAFAEALSPPGPAEVAPLRAPASGAA
ncbi:MAG: mechanosensitive ion channel family protein [Alphaproteobacteria bacterium]|nr:mechanosensitive ion channel family protein [Alphaproteobacteria bacterium]